MIRFPRTEHDFFLTDISDAVKCFQECDPMEISIQNWDSYHRKNISVTLKGMYSETALHLSFNVTEPTTRAVNTETNSAVYQDSCVEFFLMLDGTHYYNFEINPIGTILAQHGPSRSRNFLPDRIVQSVSVVSSLEKKPFTEKALNKSWEIAVSIPASVFIFDKPSFTKGDALICNFYKCGDLLPEKHYLSLFPVLTEKPDFHRKEYFRPILLA